MDSSSRLARALGALGAPALRVAVTGGLLLVSPLAAQFSQYTAPGAAVYDPLSRRDALDRAIADAFWHFGRVAVDPYIGISDFAYLETRPEGGEGGGGSAGRSDWTATATAGLRLYVPVGSRTTFVAFALPQYTWFEEDEDARRFNQRFGLGVFTYFNRLAVEARAQRNEGIGFVTAESPDRIAARSDGLDLAVEIPVGARISVIGHAGATNVENDLEGDAPLEFANLDSESRSWQAGLRYYMTSAFSISAEVGGSEADFDEGARDRSNSGDFWAAGIQWRRTKIGASIDVRSSQLDPEPGSEFTGFQGDTWNAEVSWSPRERFSTGVYARRNLAYTLTADEPFYVDERRGLRVGLGIGWRLHLDLFGEQGELDYTEAEGVDSDRIDDLTAWGATLSLPIGQRLRIRAGLRRTEVDSDLPGAGYRLDEIVGSVGFGMGSGGTWF